MYIYIYISGSSAADSRTRSPPGEQAGRLHIRSLLGWLRLGWLEIILIILNSLKYV